MNRSETTENDNRPLRPRLAWGVGIMVFVLIAGLGTTWKWGLFSNDDAAARPTFVVPEPGPLTISVTESGTIKSKEQVVIKSEVEGRPTILSLVAEGTQVEKGDLLIELDASQLQDKRVEQQIRVQNSEAAFVRARENLEVAKNQTKADISKAQLDSRFAKEDLKMYKEGEHPQQVKELEARIALAAEELQRARQKYEGSKVLYAEKYISQNELQADELAAKKAELDLQLAKDELKLLQEFTYQRRLDELQAAVQQADMALERVKRKAAADMVQARAELRAKEAEHTRQEEKLAKLEEQIEKTRIHAPRDGLVVYATSTQFSWRGNRDPLAEGQEVRERQELIHLPATDRMMVQVKIPEAKLQLIDVGLPATITGDALPGRTYRGHVTRIAPLPNATSVFLNPDLKVYDTDVVIDDTDDALRTGMSCSVDIRAAHYDNALYVPLHAVTRRGGNPVVYRRNDEGAFRPHTVEIGLDDNRLIHITAGLQAGDVVLLDPPVSGSGKARREEQDKPEQEPPEKAGDAAERAGGTAQKAPPQTRGNHAGAGGGMRHDLPAESVRSRRGSGSRPVPG